MGEDGVLGRRDRGVKVRDRADPRAPVCQILSPFLQAVSSLFSAWTYTSKGWHRSEETYRQVLGEVGE